MALAPYLLHNKKYLFFIFCFILGFSVSSLANNEGIGFQLIVFENSGLTPPDVITGHLDVEGINYLPFTMRQAIEENGIHIKCISPYSLPNTLYLLAFYDEVAPWPDENLPNIDIPQIRKDLDKYSQLMPWREKSWLAVFSSIPTCHFSRKNTTSHLDQGLTFPNLISRLDHISILAHWIMSETEPDGHSHPLQKEAKTTLWNLSDTGTYLGDAPYLTEVIGANTSALGNNVLSTFMVAAIALEQPEMVDWIKSDLHSEVLKSLVTITPAGGLNPLHLSLFKLPDHFERLLALYPDQKARVRAIQEKKPNGFNVLMHAVTERPELISTLLKYLPDEERGLLLLESIKNGHLSYNTLEQAIKKFPQNTELARTLVDACPDELTLLSLVTRESPDGWTPIIMAGQTKC